MKPIKTEHSTLLRVLSSRGYHVYFLTQDSKGKWYKGNKQVVVAWVQCTWPRNAVAFGDFFKVQA